MALNYNQLCHYGTPMHSGRYPFGSGDRPYQHRQNPNIRIAVRKGDMVQNVSSKTPRKLGSNPVYISYTDSDNKFYRTHHVASQYFYYGEDKAYINQMKAKKDIRVPAGKEITRIYQSAWTKNKESCLRTIKDKVGEKSDELIQKLDSIERNGFLSQKDYDQFIDVMPRLMYYNPEFRDQVFKDLKRIGANAIRDYEDYHGTSKWSKRQVDDPLIIINGNKTLELVSSTVINKLYFDYKQLE